MWWVQVLDHRNNLKYQLLVTNKLLFSHLMLTPATCTALYSGQWTRHIYNKTLSRYILFSVCLSFHNNCCWKQTELSNLDPPPPSSSLSRDKIKTNGLISHFIGSPPGGPGWYSLLYNFIEILHSKLLSPSDQNIFITRFLPVSPLPGPVLLYQFISAGNVISLSVSYYLSSPLTIKLENLSSTKQQPPIVARQSRHNN